MQGRKRSGSGRTTAGARRGERRPFSKFQADLSVTDSAALTRLKDDLELRSNADFLSEALALFHWAVIERRKGCRIVSESPTGERGILLSPCLERVAPEHSFPNVEINWTDAQLRDFARMASGEPAAPKPALIDLMKQA